MEKILLDYLINNTQTWFKKVELYVLADTHGYSPESAGRALRKLAEDGIIQVSYYDGRFAKNLAKYCHDAPIEKKRRVQIINNKAVEVYI